LACNCRPGQPAVRRLRLHAAAGTTLTTVVTTLTALVTTLTAVVATLTALVTTLTAVVATLTALVTTLTAAEAAAEAAMVAAVATVPAADRHQDAPKVHAVADQDPDLPAPFPRRNVPRRAPVGVRRWRRVSGR
jgi:hypothetical protein